MLTNEIEIQVKTFFGLEEVLARELQKLGAKDLEIKNRAVNCTGDLGFLYKINYSCRTALKILVPLLTFKAWDEDRFYKKLEAFPWEDYMDEGQFFAIDATVYSERFSHSQYITLKMKDAIVDRLSKIHNSRPNIDTKNPDIKLHLHIDREMVTISLDSSGDALYKRGYRIESTEAPINEVLASGMLQLAGWDGKANFLDPMCGSGTLLIEAAMIALELPAQLFRRKFAFMNWKNYDEDLFQTIKDYRMQKIKDFPYKIMGYDINRSAIMAAQSNINKVEMQDIIQIKQQDFFQSKKEDFPLFIVFNPPYDERLSIETDDFYTQIGDTFKKSYPNCLAWLISADLEAFKKIGLRPSRKIKLFNGKLECRFLQYEMYEGTKKTHKIKDKD